MKLQSTVQPLLLAVGIGDAYGSGFEFAPPEEVVRHNDGKAYHPRPSNGTKPGRYTDDTQMSLAIAESLISGESWTRENLANRFVDVYHRDPRAGYARGFESVLKQCRNGGDLLRLLKPGSDRNGAAMRSIPLGVLSTVARVRQYAEIQARITHNTPGGIASSQAAALMAHYGLRQRGRLAALPRFLAVKVPGFPWREPWSGPVPLHGVSTVRAALTALSRNRSLTALLKDCIAFTGDTDSVGAIALGAACCYREYRRDLSPRLLRDLERGPYGYDYLLEISRKLRA
jgi:ADP-ribosyl-[dinitrogen reductase] hydrolase